MLQQYSVVSCSRAMPQLLEASSTGSTASLQLADGTLPQVVLLQGSLVQIVGGLVFEE